MKKLPILNRDIKVLGPIGIFTTSQHQPMASVRSEHPPFALALTMVSLVMLGGSGWNLASPVDQRCVCGAGAGAAGGGRARPSVAERASLELRPIHTPHRRRFFSFEEALVLLVSVSVELPTKV